MDINITGGQVVLAHFIPSSKSSRVSTEGIDIDSYTNRTKG